MLADHSLAGGIVVPELLPVLLQVSQQIHSFSHPTQPFWVDCVLLEASMGQIDKWTNEEIVSGCVTLDPEARRVLYEKYSAQMYSICMRYAKDKEGAGDIFQDGFYRVYKNIGQLKNVEALSGWIKSIFVNGRYRILQKGKSNNLPGRCRVTLFQSTFQLECSDLEHQHPRNHRVDPRVAAGVQKRIQHVRD